MMMKLKQKKKTYKLENGEEVVLNMGNFWDSIKGNFVGGKIHTKLDEEQKQEIKDKCKWLDEYCKEFEKKNARSK